MMATHTELCDINLRKEQHHGRLNETLQMFNKHVPLTLFAKNKVHMKPDDVLKEYLNAGSNLPRIQDKTVCKQEQLRICLPPQVCLDDIADRNLRKFAAKENYISTYMKMSEDADKHKSPKIEAPFTDFSPVLKLPTSRFHTVSPEWRKESLNWSDHQFNSCIDLDKQLFKRWFKRRFNKVKMQG